MAVAELREHSEALSGSWEAELEALAGELRALPANADLQARLEASQRAVALLAVGFAAELEWLARCCELSGSLGEPLIAAPAALDQQVVAVRRIRLQALADRNGQSRPLRVSVPGPVVPADDEPEAAPGAAEPHPPIRGEATPKRVMRPLAERLRPADPEAVAEWQARRAKRAEVSRRRGTLATAAPRELTPELELELEPPQRRAPVQRQPVSAPAGFLTAGEACELLGISASTISRWRRGGRFGAEGVGWQQLNGRDFAFAAAAVERLEAEQEEAAQARIGELLAQLPPCAAADRG